MVAFVLEIVLNLMTNLTFGSILIIDLAATILAYIIGDLLILPITNNITATITDIGLALLTIYMFNLIWTVRTIYFIDALVAVAIGVGEWFFHMYVLNNVFPQFNEH
jgi:hypothetical protein